MKKKKKMKWKITENQTEMRNDSKTYVSLSSFDG